jgi:hypothetical protein
MARLIAFVSLGAVAFLLIRSARRVYRQVPDDFEPVPDNPKPEVADV